MDEFGPNTVVHDGQRPKERPWRRVLITIGLVLAAPMLAVVAIYAGAFLILAPMMQ
jgi:hypothetical protein